ncbi:hypothetical protein GCG54_00012360 [Colletotrichum gloeosporioides]|uniref:Uncharacterized protein n=1 Tax=Colletotrichum gloeosporioides TaxID=474922 RepID=A0A8H4FIE4_COLGL|nr:uncharacterized protein GCG54_00012360 [Colletotrichum gloeosporioides]KAF3802114.1 hypothetical protein GCG54_00012360 [Colletotrichum gloeosporioides]
MRPITQSDVADFMDGLQANYLLDQYRLITNLNLAPFLMLERNWWPANYVRSLLKRSPACITSSKGIRLPLELWLDIIEIVECDPDDCVLLAPVAVRETEGRSFLLCIEIQSHWAVNTCGDLEDTYIFLHRHGHPNQKDDERDGDRRCDPVWIREGPQARILIDLGAIPEKEDQLFGVWIDVGDDNKVAFMKGIKCRTCHGLR